MKSFNNNTYNRLEQSYSNEIVNNISAKNHTGKRKFFAKMRYFKDNSHDLFNEIFSDMEFENILEEKVQINDYQEFHNFQTKLNSFYNPDIKTFNYGKKSNTNILKEIPYKATKLRNLFGQEENIYISPNGHFFRTFNKVNRRGSTLEHYNSVIGNSLLLKGVYYYEIKILELGENTDMFFGVAAKNSEFINNERYKNFPLIEFEDCYGFDLNKSIFYSDKYNKIKNKILITIGTIITIKVDLTKGKINIYIDGECIKDNTLDIKDRNLGYYPAFSLSKGKEIQVKFGGMYYLNINLEKANKIDSKPICQYNNLENIVVCYMKIIENCLIKIINNQEISYNDSIRFFNPMINFFAKIAFNDEFIMKNYLLKYMNKNYFENTDTNKFFNAKFNFLYLIINNIEKNERQKSLLFLLDCLSEEIKNCSYIMDSSDKMKNIELYIKLYNYFLNKNLFKEILTPSGILSEFVYKKIKSQLFIIFQSTKILGISYNDVNHENIMKITKEKLNQFSNNNIYNCFSELIVTLLGLSVETQKNKVNKIHELIKKLRTENKQKEQNIDNKSLNEKKEEVFEILDKYFFNESNSKELIIDENNQYDFINKRKLEPNSYRKIFMDLINEIFENKSDNNVFNVISTIYLPLLNVFNLYYEKENSTNYSNEKLLSYLPIYCDNKNFLLSKGSQLFIQEKIIKNRKKNNIIKDIIDINLLYKELNEESYNISSYLIGLLITFSSFFEKELFDIDLYLQNRKYDKIILKWKSNSKELKINNYIENLKKLIYLTNENNVNIIEKTLRVLIPYINALLNNNFYLILPLKFMNMLKFFIKILMYHFLIYDNIKIINNKNNVEIIQIFVDLNFKLLFKENTSKLFFFNALDNVLFLYNLFSLIKNKKDIFKDININLDHDINTSIIEKMKDFNYFIKEADLEKIITLLRLYYEKFNKSKKKYLIKFIKYFGPNVFSDYKDETNILIPYILKDIKKDKNDFWFKSFIIETLFKQNLIPQIKGTINILNEEIEKIRINHIKKLKIFFHSIPQILNFISNCIAKTSFLTKYFNYYINEAELLEIDSFEERNDDEGRNDVEKYSIYCYLIYLSSFIIKELLNENFFTFCRKRITYGNIEDLKIDIIIKECFFYLEKIFLDIPKKYQQILGEREKLKNKNNKNIERDNDKNEKEELDEDLKHFYTNIINNIQVNNLLKLFSLFENNYSPRFNLTQLQSMIRKFIIFLNELGTKYNLIPKSRNSKNENQDTNFCPICLDKESDIHVSPCGHPFCFICVKKLFDRRCPICRKNIIGVIEHPEFKFLHNVQQQIRLDIQNRVLRAFQNDRVELYNRLPLFHNRLNNLELNLDYY